MSHGNHILCLWGLCTHQQVELIEVTMDQTQLSQASHHAHALLIDAPGVAQLTYLPHIHTTVHNIMPECIKICTKTDPGFPNSRNCHTPTQTSTTLHQTDPGLPSLRTCHTLTQNTTALNQHVSKFAKQQTLGCPTLAPATHPQNNPHPHNTPQHSKNYTKMHHNKPLDSPACTPACHTPTENLKNNYSKGPQLAKRALKDTDQGVGAAGTEEMSSQVTTHSQGR